MGRRTGSCRRRDPKWQHDQREVAHARKTPTPGRGSQRLNRDALIPELRRLLDAGANSHDLLVVAAHWRRLELEQWLVQKLNGRIAAGPFQGLRHPGQAHGSTLAPKLLGTYEKEIQADLLGLAAKAETFLNIGCAEGYYTTGLAARGHLRQVIGVDRDRQALRAAAVSARENGVDEICQFTTDLHEAVEQLEHIDLILIDVDGAELDVLNDLMSICRTEALTGSTLVIETDFHVDGSSNRPEIVAFLGNNQCRIHAERKQSIHNRFCQIPDILLPSSYFDQCLLGLEGRPGEQSWLIAIRDGW